MAATRPACWSEMTRLDPQYLPATLFGHPGSDDHGLGGHLVLGAHVQVRGVELDVGEAGVVEPAAPEGPDGLVETLTDPADLGL
jgi:hypothetical protein